MKKRRFISLLMVFVLCFSLFPTQAFAWKNLTHVNSADIILLEMQRSYKEHGDEVFVSLGDKEYEVPEEFWEAIFAYPDAFRAGSMGPDFYPDIIVGQMFIHPYDNNAEVGSGEWVTLLCDSLNKMPKDSNERKEALAFTLGVMLHFCGDLFGHDFINAFAGGSYPEMSAIKDEIMYALALERENPFEMDGLTAVNILFSHMAEESYMDEQVNWSFYDNSDYLNIKAPTRFVADTMVFDGSVNGGPAKIFMEKYGSVPPHFSYLLELRGKIYNFANNNRESLVLSGLVVLLDRWVADIDDATYALVDTFDRIANRMVTEAEPDMIGIVKGELNSWLSEYGVYAMPVPDFLVKAVQLTGQAAETILKAIGLDILVEKFEAWKKNLILDAVKWVTGIDEEYLDKCKKRLTDAEWQLDNQYNPFKPSSNNFAEFKEYMDRYAAEQNLLNGLDKKDLINGKDNGVLDKLIDSDLEAFYNTMTMFKMVLIGAEEFADFVEALSGVEQSAYEKNTGEVAATSLKLDIATTDVTDAGTDDDIYAVVYEKGDATPVARKLLDISGYNDFEAGDNDAYFIELPKAVPIDKIEVYIEQVGKGLANPNWDCANINITPMHAGTALIEAVGVGGNALMNSGKTWDLRYQDALAVRDIADKAKQEVMNLKIKIHTTDGTDGNVYLVAYNSSEEWVKVLLDKQRYNDFEKGDTDTYDVSLARITESGGIMTGQGIPLDQLRLKLIVEDNKTLYISWDIGKASVIPYYGNLALTEEIDLGGYKDLKPGGEWWPDFHRRHSGETGHGGGYTDYKGFDHLTYTTYVDDGLLAYTGSLDDSAQWRNDIDPNAWNRPINILWDNETIREKVFYSMFKGFEPEIRYEGPEAVDEEASFDMELTFDGFWNGITRERRNLAGAGTAAPLVNGKAVISFIDSEGNEYKTDEVTVKDGEAEATVKDGEVTVAGEGVAGNTDVVLHPGIYDVKVTYMTDGEYAPTAKIFKDALAVTEKAKNDYVVNVSASPEEGGTVSGGDNIYVEGTMVTVEATANKYYKFVNWTEDDREVSEEASYEFAVTDHRDLVAHFESSLDYIKAEAKRDSAVNYYVGESFDSDDIVVTAYYEDGKKREITNYEVIDADYLKENQTEVTIRYTENGKTRETTLGIHVEQNSLVDLKVTTQPDKRDYFAGEAFDRRGMIVTAFYKNGDEVEIEMDDETTSADNGYTLIGADVLEAGKEVIIRYTENGETRETTPKIKVQAIRLADLYVTTEPAKTTGYYVGDAFDPTGMVVTAEYNNGVVQEVTDYKLIDADSLEHGQTEVTIRYTENGVTKKTTQKIEAVTLKPSDPVVMDGLEVTREPDKTEYYAGENFNPAGMIVEVVYNNGETKVINDYTLYYTENLSAGQTAVTISYTENGATKTTTQSITVNAHEIISGGSPKKYSIAVENPEDGSIEVSHKRATIGTEITIKTDPEKGYGVEDISVVKHGSKVIEVKAIGNGEFTFKMPAADVSVTVGGQKSVGYIQLTIGNVVAEVFGKNVVNDVPPVIRNERTMLPARFIAEALGATVTWNEPDQKVMIVKEGIALEIFINEPFAVVNGTPVELDSPAFIEKDRTYLPMRFIAENLGATVVWGAADQTIRITPGK